MSCRRFVAGFLALACAGMLFAPARLTAAEADVKQLLVKHRKAPDVQRRVAAVRELVAAGPAGVSAIKDVLEKELAKLEASVPDPPKTSDFDEKIAQQRKKLVELRTDEALSKEQLKSEGLPALDQLTAAWRQREMTLSQHYQRIAKIAALVKKHREFLDKLQEAWRDDAAGCPLPAADWLARTEKLQQKAAPPVDPIVAEVNEENAKLARQLDKDVIPGMNAVNAMRVMCGLRPLVFDPKLCEAATGHSGDMQDKGFFAHESPVPGKKTFTDRAALAGTTASGENIYVGSSDAIEAIKAWFLSPGHHKNMLGEDHKRQGLGRVGKHWTQMFGR